MQQRLGARYLVKIDSRGENHRLELVYKGAPWSTEQLCGLPVMEASIRENVDPALLMAVIRHTSNFNLESEENLTLTKDNLYAKRFVYTADLGGYSYRYMQVAALKGTSVYLFTYASVPENYEKHLDAVDEMLGFLIIK